MLQTSKTDTAVRISSYLFVYSSEAPEEEYDPRSLFERLQEQKDKKQEEYEEQFKFSESFALCMGIWPNSLFYELNFWKTPFGLKIFRNSVYIVDM